MIKLEEEDPEIWNSFMRGNFSCQKTVISGTAISRDHDGEQINKILKTRGGLTGITIYKTIHKLKFKRRKMIEIIKIYTKVEKLKFRIEKDLIWHLKGTHCF